MTANMGSKTAATAALRMAMAENRTEEKELQAAFRQAGIRTAAVDFGGSFNDSVAKIIERTLVAAKRENVIGETHPEEGAVCGATHEAVRQLMPSAFGLNVGGKIGIGRFGDHVSVAIFFGVGMIHLDDMCVGIAHRAVAL